MPKPAKKHVADEMNEEEMEEHLADEEVATTRKKPKKARTADLSEDYDPTVDLEPYLRKCVKIDPLDIQGEYVRISADLAYWNDRYADALREFLASEVDLKVLKAQLEPGTRQALIDAGGKTTEAQVKAAIESDERVLEAQARAIAAEVDKNRHFGILDAIRSKKEMLVSLGAQLRAEMAGDPLLRDQVKNSRG